MKRSSSEGGNAERLNVKGTYRAEEQRRFEILDAHWDLPIKDVDLDAR